MSEAPGAAPASPCLGVCRMDPVNGLCLGCRRTLDEIAAWGSATDEEKREILARLRARTAGRRAR